MAKNKSTYRKIKLVRESRRSGAVPAWIMAKTRGKVRFSSRRRHWRRSKLKI